MKKFFSLVLVLLFSLFLTGCGEKKALTANDFSSIMQENNYKVVDISSQYANYSLIESVTIAQSTDKSHQIEFYVLSDVDTAINVYNDNVDKFESLKSGSSSYTNINVSNYSKYTLSSSGYYMVASRIDNTFIYVKVLNNYKNNIKDILDELGY